MSKIALLLGPVAFSDFEVPASIGFGGEQRLAIHELPGGIRVIDCLGQSNADIAFSGIFSGPDATSRARTVDSLRAAGLALELTWDLFFYTVVIRRFEANYEAGSWIPYRITCAVLRDEAATLIDSAVSFGANVLADIGDAAAQALKGGVDLSGAQVAFSDPQSVTRGTAAFANAQSSLAIAQGSLADGIAGADADLATTAATLAGAPSVNDGVTALAGAIGSAQRLGALTTAKGYSGRASVNLANAST